MKYRRRWDRARPSYIKDLLVRQGGLSQMKRQCSGKIINNSSSTSLPDTAIYITLHRKLRCGDETRSLAARSVSRHLCQCHRAGSGQHEGQNAPKEVSPVPAESRSLKRLKPEDLLGVLIYLASSDSDFVNRPALLIDGVMFFYGVGQR